MTESPSVERVILLGDDNQDDLLLIRRSFDRAGLRHRILSVPSGVEAIAYLNGDVPYSDRFNAPLPDLMLLDLKMPATDGFEVLRWVRAHKDFPTSALSCLLHRMKSGTSTGPTSSVQLPSW